MKGTVYGLRSTQLSLILIVLFSTTVFLWALERSPLLTSLLPPQSHSLELTPEPRTYVSVDKTKLTERDTASHQDENIVNLADKTKLTETDTASHQNENIADLAATVDSEGSSRIVNETSKISKEIPVEEKDNPASSSGDKASAKVTSETGKESTKEILTRKDEVEGHHNETLGENVSKKETNGNVEALSGSDNTSSLWNKEDNKDSIKHTKIQNQVCSYAKGKWVVDDNLPLYSGFDCKQWLSPMWSCRLTQRTDFSYEKLRWQPKGCQMEGFEGSKFLRRMKGKTLAFVGDSLGRQQFQSLMCMITGGKETNDVKDVGEEYGLAMPVGATRPNGWAYRFTGTNTTVLYYWSASLCDLEPIDPKNPDTDYAMHLDRPPSFLRWYLPKINVLVLNTGHHWNRGKFRANRWVMHVGGAPNTDKRLAPVGSAKDFTIHSIIKWVDTQLPGLPGLKAFYRSISPRHFVNGDWNTGGSCNNTTPMSVGKELAQDESSDQSAASAVKGTGVRLLDVTGLSTLRDEGHMSRFSITGSPGVQDCLHWCLPGVPDTWNELLAAQI